MISVPSVCLSVRNSFSPSLMSQNFWNLVYSLSGVKVRECPSLFLIFEKFGPGGPKNDRFWPFFLPFLQFFGLKNFFRELIFFIYWSPEFFRRDLWFQSRPFLRSSVCNAFFPSLMSQIFWNVVYSFPRVKVRECLSLFWFSRISVLQPAKRRPFLAIFKVFWTWNSFLESDIFYFSMWCFWAYLEVIYKGL